VGGEELPEWAVRLVELRTAAGWGRAELARRLRGEARRRGEAQVPDVEHLVRSVRRWEAGRVRPGGLYADLLDTVLGVSGAAMFDNPVETAAGDDADEVGELLDLARRAEASDVGRTALDALDWAVIDLARRYARTPPGDLLHAVRRRARDVGRLLDGKATLGERHRLLVAGGWLALLAATVHVDLGRRYAARVARDTAVSLGREAGEPELIAWAVEGAAWEGIVDREWPEAVALARAGAERAPRGGSAAVQLAAQDARASARLGDRQAVHDALGRAARLLHDQRGDHPPDSHFTFDPRKLTSYTATALAWLGDPSAEDYARKVIDGTTAPRRLATARIDLALILTDLDRPEEAAALGAQAVDSGRLVPSNLWRAAELDAALTRWGELDEVHGFRDRYAATRRAIDAATVTEDGSGSHSLDP
jgi:transcriptional regulator with XRE-family HTH domain